MPRPSVPHLLVALAAVAPFGCPRPPPPRPPELSTLPSAEAALARLRTAGADRSSLRALGRATYFGSEGRVRLGIVMVIERPDRFRVETLSPMEQPIDVMVSDGGRLRLLREGRLFEGPATPENIARILPVPLRPEDLVDAMLGGVPTGDRFRPTELTWADEDQRDWLLVLEGPGGERARLTVDPARAIVKTMRLERADGLERLRVVFDKHEAVAPAAGEFPRSVSLTIPERKDEVSLRWRDIDVNVPLDPALFSLQPPPGVRPEPLDSPPVPLPPG